MRRAAPHIAHAIALAACTTLLLAQPDRPIPTLPDARGGQDRIGTRLESPGAIVWALPPRDTDKPVRATLYRWWTDACPFCRDSLPALDRLRRHYEPHGLRVVAIYHPKPPGSVAPAAAIAAAQRLNFHGPIAIDAQWAWLRTAYLDTGRRRATSVSFLIDSRNTTRFLHPGPVLHPSDDPRKSRENNDYILLEQAIRALLEIDDDVPLAPPVPEPAPGTKPRSP